MDIRMAQIFQRLRHHFPVVTSSLPCFVVPTFEIFRKRDNSQTCQAVFLFMTHSVSCTGNLVAQFVARHTMLRCVRASHKVEATTRLAAKIISKYGCPIA